MSPEVGTEPGPLPGALNLSPWHFPPPVVTTMEWQPRGAEMALAGGSVQKSQRKVRAGEGARLQSRPFTRRYVSGGGSSTPSDSPSPPALTPRTRTRIAGFFQPGEALSDLISEIQPCGLVHSRSWSWVSTGLFRPLGSWITGSGSPGEQRLLYGLQPERLSK